MEIINKNDREYEYSKEREQTLHNYTQSDKFKEDISKAEKDHPTTL